MPTEEKKRKAKEFYFRVAVLFCYMLGFVIVIAAVAILPAEFLSIQKMNLANQKLQAFTAEPVLQVDQDTTNALATLNTELNTISTAEKDQFLVSQNIIKEVIIDKMPNIQITEFFYTNDPVKGNITTIRGIAADRQALLSFKQTLGSDPAFSSVDLPIANFVKDTDIDFSLNVTSSKNDKS